MNQEEQKYHLSSVLKAYCPHSDAHEFIVNTMDNNPEVTPKDYVLALADGLKYGNWPWISQHGDTTRSLMNTSHRFHNTSCPAYAGNEFQCDCGMVK